MLNNKLNTKFGDWRMVMVQFIAVAATLIPRLTSEIKARISTLHSFNGENQKLYVNV